MTNGDPHEPPGERSRDAPPVVTQDVDETPRATPPWGPLDWWALAGVTLLAGWLRLQKLGVPRKIMFDELYYAKEACYYVRASLKACRLDSVDFEVHPPLGKWMIGAGIDLLGFDSYGWRIVPALAGTVTVALLFLLARKLFRSTAAATITAGLLVLDLLHFVQSRIAMLDVFVPLFGVAALLFLTYDRDDLIRAATSDMLGQRPGLRPWRIAAGVAGGAALASKWSGGLIVLTIIVLAVAWETSARRAKTDRPLLATLGDEGPSIFLALVFLPALVYVMSYVGRIDGALLTAPWSEASWFSHFWDHQIEIFDVHRTLDANHSYESPAWSWPLLKRPVAYFYDGSDNSHILATGAPFIWWSSLLALAFTAYRWARNRSSLTAPALIVTGFAFSYIPWLLLGGLSDRSAVFIFYMLPSIPFMCLAVGYLTTQIGRSWEARAAIGLYAVAAAALFAFYFPIVANRPLSDSSWRQRLWIFDSEEGCRKPEGRETTTSITETIDGTERVRAESSNTNETLPPEGWCWI